MENAGGTARALPRTAWRPIIVLLAVYFAVALGLLTIWSARAVYSVTGDEPHYLVMADSLVRYHSLELSHAYRDEFAGNAIYSFGLGAVDSPLEAPYAHVLLGPNGYYSWHGPGLSMLAAPPFAVFGAIGAKVVMVLFGGLAVVLAWRISGVALAGSPLGRPWSRFWAVLALSIGYPLIGASTQLYPDLLAGTVALGGMWMLLTPDIERRSRTLWGYGAMLSFLPWLGTKFVIVEGLLLLGIFLQVNRRQGRRSLHLLWPAALSMALLLAYNVHAFGRLTGPEVSGALEASRTSLMVFLGLLLDQDEGSLLQNAGLMLGLLGLIPFLKRFRYAGILWLLTVAAFWLPSAMHPGWYGIGSFVGRYSWALSLLLVIPALIGLGWIAQRSVGLARALMVALIAFHLFAAAALALVGGGAPGMSRGLDLYTKPTDTWLESYSIFYFPLHNWLPALYNDSWAYEFLPNYAWVLAAIALVLTGWRAKVGLSLLAASLMIVVISGLLSSPGPRRDIVAVEINTPATPGFLDATVVRQMRSGPYVWSVTYSSAARPGIPAGEWQVVRSDTSTVVASGQLPGTSGASRTQSVEIPYRSLLPAEYFMRVAHYGVGDFTLSSLAVDHR